MKRSSWPVKENRNPGVTGVFGEAVNVKYNWNPYRVILDNKTDQRKAHSRKALH